MKSLLLLPLLCMTLCLSARPPAQIEFYEGELEELQQQASQYGKMSLVYFYASWCMPCQWMEKNTYRNNELAAYMEKYYFPIRVNIDAPDGNREKKKYMVTLLPTFLIFDGEGNLVARYEESMDSEKLLHLLKKNNLFPAASEHRPSRPHSPVLQAPKAKNIYYPPLIPEGLPIKSQSTAELAESSQGVATPPQSDDPSPIPNYHPPAEFYYGVQVGAFSSRQNAEQEMKILRKKLKEDLHVFKETLQNRTIYKLIAGRFDQQEEAIRCMRRVKNKEVFGFVKKIDK